MLGHAGASRVDVWLVLRVLPDSATQVVMHSQLGAAAKKVEHSKVAACAVLQLLASGSNDIDVGQCVQCGRDTSHCGLSRPT